jgi:hypothetical protein
MVWSMFEVGEKVVCVDANIHPEIAFMFTDLPQEGVVYTVRDCEPGRSKWGTSQGGWDSVDMKVLLVELKNPIDPSTEMGCPGELGFAARRFRPLEEIQHTSTVEEEMLVPVGR